MQRSFKMSDQPTPRVRIINQPNSNMGSVLAVGSQRRATVTIVSLEIPQLNRGSDGEDIPRFMTADLTVDTAAELADFLQDQNDFSSGVVVIIIEGWQSWLAPAVREALPSFPTSFLDEFVTNREIAMLPRFEGQREMSSVMEHVDVLPKSMIDSQPSSTWRLGEYGARRIPLATWVDINNKNTSSISRPIIVISGDQGFDIRQKLMSHYCANGPRRWARLNEIPYWIYLDLFYIFTKWDRTWEAVRGNLEALEKQIYSPELALSTLYQTRRLHRDTGTTLALRESIRLHTASLKRFNLGIDKLVKIPDPAPVNERLGKSAGMAALRERLEDVSQLLEYYELTSSTILEQQQNLLSLIFNTDAMNQGKAIGRLTAVGFFFLPLSYVATLWGITTWQVEAHWYPVAAVPVLLLTFAAAILVNKLATSRELVEPYPRQYKQTTLDRPKSKPIANTTVPNSTAQVDSKLIPATGRPSFHNYDPEPILARPRSPSLSQPAPRIRFQVRGSFTEERYEEDVTRVNSAPRASAAVLSGRSRVVSRIDSDMLHPSSYYDEEGQRRSYSYRNATLGAKNAPSGMLRHDV